MTSPEGASAASPQGASTTSPEEAKAVIRRWNDEGWSGGNYDLAQEIIAPVMTVHGAGGQAVGMGPDGLVDLIRTWRTAFPDGRMTVDDLIVEGDLVGIRNTWHGTHTGDFYGIPATGKTVHVTSIGIDRVKDGQVVEGWGELDMIGMMQQLGAMPPVGPGAAATGSSPEWGPSPSPAGGTTGASTAANKTLAVRFVETVGAGEAASLADVVDSDVFVDHNPVWGTSNWHEAVASMAALRAAMPDLAVQVEHDIVIAEGDQVEVHSIVTGTHTGADLFGVAASGKKATWSSNDFLRIVGGRVVERWVSADTLTLFQQLGVVPSPGG
ncbi:MAG TPA: ester cyclase family protein [Acidimicrobiales bacterium]|nr:ester cyclase family protein [Acidimicrobiales bacterium]